jgi:hypothetical protein
MQKLQDKLSAKFQTALEKTSSKSLRRLLCDGFKKVDHGVFVSQQVDELRKRIASELQIIQLNIRLQMLTLVSGTSKSLSSLSKEIITMVELLIQTALATATERDKVEQQPD